jgi:hypothetical protein
LTFVAIPLETFVHSLRTILGLVAIGILRVTALVLRLVGSASRYIGVLLAQLYDLPLFIPLWWAARDGGNRRRTDSKLQKVTP